MTSQLPSKTKRPTKTSKYTRLHKVTKAIKRKHTETTESTTLSFLQVEVTENAELATPDVTYSTGVDDISMATTSNETDPEVVVNSTTSPMTTSTTTLQTTTEDICKQFCFKNVFQYRLESR